jgi:hypothetical protein
LYDAISGKLQDTWDFKKSDLSSVGPLLVVSKSDQVGLLNYPTRQTLQHWPGSLSSTFEYIMNHHHSFGSDGKMVISVIDNAVLIHDSARGELLSNKLGLLETDAKERFEVFWESEYTKNTLRQFLSS